MLALEPARFLAGKRDSCYHSTTCFIENVVVAKTSYQSKKFYHFAIGRGLTSCNKDNGANFSGEKKYNEAIRGVHFFENTRKNFLS